MTPRIHSSQSPGGEPAVPGWARVCFRLPGTRGIHHGPGGSHRKTPTPSIRAFSPARTPPSTDSSFRTPASTSTPRAVRSPISPWTAPSKAGSPFSELAKGPLRRGRSSGVLMVVMLSISLETFSDDPTTHSRGRRRVAAHPAAVGHREFDGVVSRRRRGPFELGCELMKTPVFRTLEAATTSARGLGRPKWIVTPGGRISPIPSTSSRRAATSGPHERTVLYRNEGGDVTADFRRPEHVWTTSLPHSDSLRAELHHDSAERRDRSAVSAGGLSRRQQQPAEAERDGDALLLRPAARLLAKKQTAPADFDFSMTLFKGLLTGETTIGIPTRPHRAER